MFRQSEVDYAAPAGRGLSRLVALFRRAATRDTSIVAATTILLNGLRVVSSMILTRLLQPEMFGVTGILGSVAFVMAMISDLGFHSFVVRHAKGDDPHFLDVIWTIRLLRALVLTVVTAVLAGPIASGFGKPELALVIAVFGLTFLLDGLSSLSVLTALRNRQLKRLSLLDLIGAVAQLLFVVALALVWKSYWSMVIGMLLAAALRAVLSYTMFDGTGRRLRLDRDVSVELWRFARFITGSSIISMLIAQADKIMLSRLFALDMLGRYMLAVNLAAAPALFAAIYANRVLYPAYSRVWRETPDLLRAAYYDRRRVDTMLYMAGVGALIGLSPLVIGLLYDPRYAEASVYLRLLLVGPLLAIGNCAANDVLTASGRVYINLHVNIVRLLWLATAVPLAYWFEGPLGLIAAVGAVEAPALLYSWWQLRRAGLLRMREELAMLAAGAGGIAAGYALLNAI